SRPPPAPNPPGGELVAPDGFYRGKADVDLPAFLLGCPDDGAGRQLGLEHRRYRLRATGHAVARPVELRSIEGRRMHAGDMHGAVVVLQLDAQRVGEATAGELGCAVG